MDVINMAITQLTKEGKIHREDRAILLLEKAYKIRKWLDIHIKPRKVIKCTKQQNILTH